MLANAFTGVSLVETSIFMKTMKRRRAVLDETGTLKWEPALTPAGALLDALLAENYVTVERWLRPLATSSSIERRVAFGCQRIRLLSLPLRKLTILLSRRNGDDWREACLTASAGRPAILAPSWS